MDTEPERRAKDPPVVLVKDSEKKYFSFKIEELFKFDRKEIGMAHYDDWVYERGLEDEDWVHDRWGDDDDWDDGWDDVQEQEEGEEDVVENNRISFAKEYTELEKIIIKAQIKRVLAELKEMSVGPSSFKLNDEVMAVYNKKGELSFKVKDDPDSFETYNSRYYSNNYSNLTLFLIQWKDIKKDILLEKGVFEDKEKKVLSVSFTREDGIGTILEAFKNGANVDISKYLELPDLTDKEKEAFVNHGYGYDLYFEESASYDLRNIIRYNFCRSSYLSPNEEKKLKEWIKENPDKCILQKNRNRTNQEMEEDEEEDMELG